MDGMLYVHGISHNSPLPDNLYYEVPAVSSISGLYRHIMLAQQNDVEILEIDFIKLSCIKHPHPPLWQTMKPVPTPGHLTFLLWSLP